MEQPGNVGERISSPTSLWHSFMYRPVHPSFGRVKTNMDG